MSNIETADWLTAAGLLGTAFAWMYQWHSLRYRSKLKDDLEILSKLKVGGDHKEEIRVLENHIRSTIGRAYPVRTVGQTTFVPWTDLSVGLLFTVGALLWVLLIPDNVNDIVKWIVAASLAFVGVGGFLNAHDERKK